MTHYSAELPEFVGRGNQGTVYRLSAGYCIKIYCNSEYAKREKDSYMRAGSSSILPTIYKTGPNYIVMEYIQGTSLQTYLAQGGQMNMEVSAKLLHVIREMKRMGFTRIDAGLFHIFLTNQGGIKIIDLVNAYTKQYTTPYVLLDGLKARGGLQSFYEELKKLDYSLYEQWSREVY